MCSGFQDSALTPFVPSVDVDNLLVFAMMFVGPMDVVGQPALEVGRLHQEAVAVVVEFARGIIPFGEAGFEYGVVVIVEMEPVPEVGIHIDDTEVGERTQLGCVDQVVVNRQTVRREFY